MSTQSARNFFRMGFALCFLMAVFQMALLAQQVTGSILGTVTDASSAALAHANITITNTDTHQVLHAITSAVGSYRFDALPIGTYQVEATANGFRSFTVNDVELQVNQERRVDVKMEVGTVQEKVEVTAAALQVETTNTQLGVVLQSSTMLNLPLNGRSFTDLLSLQAGVVPVSGQGETSQKVSGIESSGNYSVNGEREANNAFLVNGADTSEAADFGTLLIPNLDSIAEFRLITDSFDAEFGRFSGSVMNAITKSGTNSIHGDVFEFNRNTAYDGRGYFSTTVPILRRNQYGFTVGGPAIKNKLFWFSDYEATRQSQGLPSSVYILPTQAQRSGVFAPGSFSGTVVGTYWAGILSQELGVPVTSGESYNSVFPNGVIPARAISPIATNLLNAYVPLPNAGGNNYVSPQPVGYVDDNKIGERVDFINKRTGNWFAYYHHDYVTSTTPGTFSPGNGNLNTAADTGAQAIVVSNVKTFGSTIVNEALVSYTRGLYISGIPTYAPLAAGGLSALGFVTGGLGIVAPNTPGTGIWQPGLNLNEFSVVAGSDGNHEYENTYHASETFSKVYGRHTIKFGGEYTDFEVNDTSFSGNGSFTFNGTETGNDVADLIIGAPNQYNQSSNQVIAARSKYGAAFVQDSWRATPNFTANMGLRWEASQPWWDTQGRLQALVPGFQSTQYPTAPEGLLFPGDKGPNGQTIPQTLAPTKYNNFGPRLGLAWAPVHTEGILGKLMGNPGQFSIRAAVGLYYTAIQEQSARQEEGDAPYGQYWVSAAPTLFSTPYVTRATGVSQGQRFPFVYPQPGSAAAKNYDFSVFEPITSTPGYMISNRTPYSEHFNLSIQRQFSAGLLLTMAYVGSEGHRLITYYEANPGNPALCLSLMGSGVAPGTQQCGPNLEDQTFTLPNGVTVPGTRPLGQAFSWNQYECNCASSNYHSFQTSFQRNAKGLTFLAAYTFSKSIDDGSSYGASTDYANFRLSRGLSAFDVRNNFVASYNYTLPFDKISSALPSRLTGGWSLNGITHVASGFPVPIYMTSDDSLVGTGHTGGGLNETDGVDRPNYLGGLHVTRNVRNTPNHQLFNSSAFAAEVLGTQGDSKLYFFSGPGEFQTDLGAEKSTPLHGENMSFLIRAEFFNVFGHTQFITPTASFDSSSFSQVTAAQPGRIGQLSAKFIW
jgi:Carboxypeptidase regulatory-like domain